MQYYKASEAVYKEKLYIQRPFFMEEDVSIAKEVFELLILLQILFQQPETFSRNYLKITVQEFIIVFCFKAIRRDKESP